MKKTTLLIISFLVFPSCGESIPEKPIRDTRADEIAGVLNGHFIGSRESLGQAQFEELSFSPYSSTENVVSLFGTFDAYGTVSIIQYYGDHLLEIKKDCYYSVYGNSSTVSFYQYDKGTMNVKSGEDKRRYTPINAESFKLCESGLTDDNASTYLKQ